MREDAMRKPWTAKVVRVHGDLVPVDKARSFRAFTPTRALKRAFTPTRAVAAVRSRRLALGEVGEGLARLDEPGLTGLDRGRVVGGLLLVAPRGGLVALLLQVSDRRLELRDR